ncbi:hypothetical protein EMCRGX_G033071 [Ephydatia muelleri]|eukprot:Em0019g901a
MEDFVAGWFGGAAGLVVGHPFDTVKARLQTEGITASKVRYKGTVHCFAHIIRSEGLFSLYKGMASPMIGMAAINAIVFGVQGNLMRRMQSDDHTPMWVKSSLSGMAAGAVQSFICCPVELFKLRRQIQEDHVGVPVFGHHGDTPTTTTTSGSKHSLLHIAGAIYRKEGGRGFFKGLTATLWREVPSFGAYFATYDLACQTMLQEDQSIHDLSPIFVCLAGGLSGIAAWLVTYPVDLVKSRIQIDGVDGPPRYRNMLDCFRKTYQESRTIRVFFKGLNSTLIRAFPVNAVTFATVTLILRQWRKEEE